MDKIQDIVSASVIPGAIIGAFVGAYVFKPSVSHSIQTQDVVMDFCANLIGRAGMAIIGGSVGYVTFPGIVLTSPVTLPILLYKRYYH
jgi:prolipoprotein diacylglyceryltransferase